MTAPPDQPSRRRFVQSVGAAAATAALATLTPAARGIADPAASDGQKTPPALEVPRLESMQLRGPLGDRAAANVRHWLLVAPAANPAMLQMFRDRDRTPPRDLVPWAGEFAGKYLISAVQAIRLGAEPALREHL